MPTMEDLFASDRFNSLPKEAKYIAMGRVSNGFSTLPSSAKDIAFERLSKKFGGSEDTQDTQKSGGVDIPDTMMSAHTQPEQQPEAPESKAASPEDTFTEKMTEYGRKLAYDLGIPVRWGVEGAARLIGSGSDQLGRAIGKLPGIPEYTGSLEETASNALTKIGIPEEVGSYKQSGEVMKTATGAAIGAGAAGAIARGVGGITGQVAKTLASDPGQQIAGAAGASIGQQTAEEAGAGPIGQTAAAIAGSVAGAGAVGLGKSTFVKKAVNPAVEEAENLGIRVMTSDVKKPRTFMGKSAQAVGERIPLAGTGGWRRKQVEQQINAIKGTLAEFGADDATLNASDDVMRELAKKRSGALKHYKSKKQSVFKKLDSVGDVPVNNTIGIIDEEINKLKGISESQLSSPIKRLEDLKFDIQGKNISAIEENRRLIGDYLKDKDLATIRDTASKSFDRVYGAINRDMGDFIMSNGGKPEYGKWKSANKQLRQLAGELDVGVLKSTLRRGEATPELVQKMLFSKKKSDIKLLWRNLNDDGKRNARAAILQKAAKESMDAEGNISPRKFSGHVKKLGDSIGVFFSGNDLKRMEGLSKALELTKRASDAPVHPVTGAQNVPFVGGAVLSSLFGGTVPAISAAASVGVTARVLESRPVRNMLMRLPELRRGSNEEAAMAKRLINVMLVEYEKLQEDIDNNKSK